MVSEAQPVKHNSISDNIIDSNLTHEAIKLRDVPYAKLVYLDDPRLAPYFGSLTALVKGLVPGSSLKLDRHSVTWLIAFRSEQVIRLI